MWGGGEGGRGEIIKIIIRKQKIVYRIKKLS